MFFLNHAMCFGFLCPKKLYVLPPANSVLQESEGSETWQTFAYVIARKHGSRNLAQYRSCFSFSPTQVVRVVLPVDNNPLFIHYVIPLKIDVGQMSCSSGQSFTFRNFSRYFPPVFLGKGFEGLSVFVMNTRSPKLCDLLSQSLITLCCEFITQPLASL